MSVLEDYEKQHGLDPLTPGQISDHVEAAENFLAAPSPPKGSVIAERMRVICWLHDRLQAVYAALDNPKAPIGVSFRCSYCWNAAGRTEEVWQALPKADYDDAVLHAQVCEHNPLVQDLSRVRRDRDAALIELEELRGRKIGKADAWAEAADESTGMYHHMRGLHEAMKATIRSLLATETPAGELRRSIGELVK